MEQGQATQAVIYYIQHLAVLLNRQSDQILQEQLGIGLSQFRILQTLQTNPSIQQKQIAHLLGQTEASISRQVSLMQRRGMLAAEANPQNRREHITMLLPKGERFLEAGQQALERYHEPLLKSLKGKEQVTLVQMLGEIHVGICTVDDVEGMVHVGGWKTGS